MKKLNPNEVMRRFREKRLAKHNFTTSDTNPPISKENAIQNDNNDENEKDICERCGNPTNNRTTISIFDTSVICLTCKGEECLHPDYQKAVEAERQANINGNFNFEGIGYTKL